MESSHERLSAIEPVIAMQQHLARWLHDHALPLWDRHGVDRVGGGYFETLASQADGTLLACRSERRGRVVARQLYVFEVGRRAGWQSSFADPIDHGCDYLFLRMHLGSGRFATAVDAQTYAPRAPFSLYEHAFYLFALAHATVTQSHRHPVVRTAEEGLAHLRHRLAKPDGGFDESTPPTMPLKSNPHMHLLEAAMAWIGVTHGPPQHPWIDLAHELVDLCLTRFMDPDSGAVREYFDHRWRPAVDLGRIVEPGHQFEWAWLLMRWASSDHCEPAKRTVCRAAAMRLVKLGEAWGVDASRGIAVNEIWDDMSIKDPRARLWPQTERVKAWCAVLDQAQHQSDMKQACRGIEAAVSGLTKYLHTERPGLWHEVCEPDGNFAAQACKASSLYHIVGAIEALDRAVDGYRTHEHHR